MLKLSFEYHGELFMKVLLFLFIVNYNLNWFLRGYVGLNLKLKQAQAPLLMKTYCLSLPNLLVPQEC